MATMIQILNASANANLWFETQMKGNGHKAQTTFYGDFTIAEFYGEKGIRETYEKVKKDWLRNYEHWSELVVALNWKIWEWYYKKNEVMAKVYDELWKDSTDSFIAKWGENKKACAFYFRMTD